MCRSAMKGVISVYTATSAPLSSSKTSDDLIHQPLLLAQLSYMTRTRIKVFQKSVLRDLEDAACRFDVQKWPLATSMILLLALQVERLQISRFPRSPTASTSDVRREHLAVEHELDRILSVIQHCWNEESSNPIAGPFAKENRGLLDIPTQAFVDRIRELISERSTKPFFLISFILIYS